MPRGGSFGGITIPGKGGGYAYSIFKISDMSGGVNLRDAQTQLASNESPDLWNVVIDERGGVVKRLGMSRYSSAAMPRQGTTVYDSRVASKILWYSQADGKLYSDPNTGVLTLRKTFTAGQNISIVDFIGSVYAIHPVDGIWKSTDGVTWTLLVATAGTLPTGEHLAVWQNKLWVSGGNKVSFSKAGDASNWDTAAGAGSNIIREGRDGEAPITVMLGSTSFDTQLRPSLVVFKDHSFHVITDSSTGAYMTMDQYEGAPNPGAVAAQYGRLYVLNPRGMFQTDGLSPMVPISGKLDKLFRFQVDQIASSFLALVGHQGKIYGTMMMLNGNLMAFRYNPLFEAYTFGSDCGQAYLSKNKTLLTCGESGWIYEMDDGGSDDGVAIASRFNTRIFEPFQSIPGRLQKLTLRIGGNVSMRVWGDLLLPAPDVVSLAGDVTLDESYVFDYPRLESQSFQLAFSETSSSTRSVSSAQGSLTVGAWAVYGMELAFNQLSSI